jgi:hypothetical protein
VSRLDQFSSVFKSAAKTVFHREEVSYGRGLIVTDLEDYQARLFADRVQSFLTGIGSADMQWAQSTAGEVETVGALLEHVETHQPNLICTYRNLYSSAWRWPYTLGDHLEVLTQVTDVPVLVLPRLDDEAAWESVAQNTDVVMAMTDHLTGDDRLVNAAAAFTAPGGALHLCHIEDEATFERYMDAIAKIPSIDTDTARADLRAQLLKEPHDYIRSCRAVLEANDDAALKVVEHVLIEHHLTALTRLIQEHDVDLLVMNTKDDDQLAMHGLAYPLAVQLRSTPMLML